MKNILLITILGLFGSCGSNTNSKLSEKTRSSIKSALTTLSNSQKSDAFVIIEEPDSGKFVQFSGNANEELYFSLPTAQMNAAELTKAKSALKNYDIAVEDIQLFSNDSARKATRTLNEFNKKMGKDVDQGVKLVSIVMTQIFGFKENVVLTITEN